MLLLFGGSGSTVYNRTASASVATLTEATSRTHTATFTTSGTLAQLLALIADEGVDVIEFANGTYNLAQILIDVDRTHPLTMRPASGATVTFSPGAASGNQFAFGTSSRAGNITMTGFVFDGYSINDTGIIGVGNSHDITVNNMTVRNCTAVLSSSS